MRKHRKAGTNNGDRGPKMPHLLKQELGEKGTANGQTKVRGRSMYHVSQRKVARKLARKAKKQPQKIAGPKTNLPSGQMNSLPNKEELNRPHKKRRMDPIPLLKKTSSSTDDSSDSDEPEKIVNLPVKKKLKPVKTKFNQLLDADVFKGTDEKAVAAELELQKQLAKKLGMKQKQNSKHQNSIDDVFKEDFMMGSEEDSDEDNFSEEENKSLDSEDEFDGSSDSNNDESGSEDDESEADLQDLDSNVLLQQSHDDKQESSEDFEIDSGIENQEETESEEDDLDPAIRRNSAKTASTSGRAQSSLGKYVPPFLRNETGNYQNSALRKRVTGLINKLSDENLPKTVEEILKLFDSESRRDVADICSELLLQAVIEGPKASDRFTAVTSCFISSVSARGNSIEIGANFVAKLGSELETSFSKKDSLASSNLANLISHLYLCGLISAGLIFSLLERLRKSFKEEDVVIIHLILKTCGLRLRADDSVSMKDFVIGINSTATEHKGQMTERTEIMLELVMDIKNNRKSKNASDGKTLESYLSQGTQRWLKESKVEEVQLKNLTWERLLDPQKKGLWWLPKAGELQKVTGINKLLQDESNQFGHELLQLASKQRMNTDVRRAIFCVIMGSEDYIDASERLLRLPLKGESQREIVRVAVECCLQENAWNPFYAALLEKILQSSQAHCITAQFCIWDHLKTLKGQPGQRILNLARLSSTLILNKALPFTALRAANLDAIGSKKEIEFWQTFFERILQGAKDPNNLASIFKPIAQPHLQSFAMSIARYLQEDFDVLRKTEASVAEKIHTNCRAARKQLCSFKRSL